jgi:hypothetical protein
MILEAPAIVRAASLDALSPTHRHAILVNSSGNFLGFVRYSLFELNGRRHNFYFRANGNVHAAAGLKVPNIPDIGWFERGAVNLQRDDQLMASFFLDGRLI